MTRRPRMRGAALLLVLWLIVLLATLVGTFAVAARVENQQGRLLSRGLVADQAARAGLEYAMTRIELDDDFARWHPDGRPYPWRFHGAEVEVRIVDERDEDALVQLVGGAEDADYAAAGRPYGAKDAPFESIAELEQVLGMTPSLYEALAAHVTVHSRMPVPDPQFASVQVLQAMGVDADPILAARAATGAALAAAALPGAGSGTYSIDSRARLGDGRISVLRAVVRTGGGAIPGTAYQVLRWEEGASAR